MDPHLGQPENKPPGCRTLRDASHAGHAQEARGSLSEAAGVTIHKLHSVSEHHPSHDYYSDKVIKQQDLTQ